MSRRQVIIYPIAALLSALMLFSGMLVRLSVVDDHRAGVPAASSRTDPSDNYVYFSLLKQGTSACQRQTAPFVEPIQGNGLACTYIGGLLVGHTLWKLADAIAPSKRIAVSILLILNTTLLSLTFLWAVGAILGREFSLLAATAVAAATLYTLDNFAVSFYARQPYLHFADVLSLEPGFARLVNPSLFWALGLATVALLFSQMRRPTAIGFVVLFCVSLLSGLAGLAVSACIVMGCGLFTLWSLARRMTFAWPAIVSAAGLAGGLLFALVSLRQFYGSDLGGGLKHGQFGGLVLNWAMLWLLLPLFFGKIVLEKADQNVLVKCLLFAAMVIGLVCESFELGARLWLRGASVVAFLVCAGWLWVRMEVLLRAYTRPAMLYFSFGKYPAAEKILAIILVFVLMPILAGMARPPGLDAARWFVDRDKLDALVWLDARSNRMTRIASTSIEDSFLIDFYTKGAPYVPLYGMTVLPYNAPVERYLSIIKLIKEDDAKLARLGEVSRTALGKYSENVKAGFSSPPDHDIYESLAFYHMLLYYPYDSRATDVFHGDRPDEAFLKRLKEIKASASARPSAFAYLIVRTDEQLKDEAAFKPVYQNASYRILEPLRSAANG